MSNIKLKATRGAHGLEWLVLFFFVRSNSKARHRGEYTSLWSVLRKLWNPLGETYVCYCATEAACYCCVTSKQAMLGDGSLASTPCMMLPPGRMNVSRKAVGRMVQ